MGEVTCFLLSAVASLPKMFMVILILALGLS